MTAVPGNGEAHCPFASEQTKRKMVQMILEMLLCKSDIAIIVRKYKCASNLGQIAGEVLEGMSQ